MRRILGDTAQNLRCILKNTAHVHMTSEKTKRLRCYGGDNSPRSTAERPNQAGPFWR
jgi:hypothetical protein